MQAELGNPQNNNSTPIFCREHQSEGQKKYITMGEAGLQIVKQGRKKPATQPTNTAKKPVVKAKVAKISVIKAKAAKVSVVKAKAARASRKSQVARNRVSRMASKVTT